MSRRGLLVAGAAAALAGCARPPVIIETPTASPSGPPLAQLAAAMSVYRRNTSQLGVAVKDLNTGVEFDDHGDYSSQSASMAKVMIVAMALRKARDAGKPLTFEQSGWASEAIINSDNDSADKLWDFAGGPEAYQELANDLKLPDTHSDAKNAFWSWTWTTPKDQVLLLDRLLDGTPALAEQDRLYLLDLMRKTNPAQTWGVGNVGDAAGVDVQMKNGWVQFKSSDGLWAVNSMGVVGDDKRRYSACFMCRVPTFEEGRRLLDEIGASVFAILGRGPLRA